MLQRTSDLALLLAGLGTPWLGQCGHAIGILLIYLLFDAHCGRHVILKRRFRMVCANFYKHAGSALT